MSKKIKPSVGGSLVVNGILLLIISVIAFIKSTAKISIPIILAIGIIILVFFLFRLIYSHKIKKHLERADMLTESYSLKSTANQTQAIKEYAHVIEELKKLKVGTKEITKRTYEKILSAIISDCKITDEEKENLKLFEDLLQISEADKSIYKRNAFYNVFNSFIEDRYLSETEEKAIENVYLQLDIPQKKIEREKKFLSELSMTRKVSKNDLPEIQTSIKLENNEKCYFSTNSAILFNSRQSDGYFYPVKPELFSGQLHITNNRLVIGENSIPFKNITNIKISSDNISASIRFPKSKSTNDYSANTLIYIFRKEYKKPYILKIPQPYLVKAIIEKYLK